MKRRIWLLVLLMIFFVLPISFQSIDNAKATQVDDDLAPEPWLLEPVLETADLTGKEALTFKWRPDPAPLLYRKYYDFRLYKGYQTYESTLILKKRVDPNVYSIVLDASLFEDGQVYTWTLRQVYCDIRKSDAAYNSFEVIKK
ncbi:MAG: hypothetical protein ABIC68_05355 [Candidatus Omnitrophota bacterium]